MIGDILQPTHLLFILVVALLVLGPKRLPEVARSLGSGIRDFRSAISGEQHEEPSVEPPRYDPPRYDPPRYELYDESGQRTSQAEEGYAVAQEAQPLEPAQPVAVAPQAAEEPQPVPEAQPVPETEPVPEAPRVPEPAAVSEPSGSASSEPS